jgi:glycosyltransferase involved in cell wall biosynthesis
VVRKEKKESALSPGKAGKNIAIIHLTFEGLQVGGGGVCTVNRGHLAALPGVQQALERRGIRLTPHYCEILYGEDAPHYDRESLARAESALKDMGGDLHFLLNFTSRGRPESCNWPGGEDFFGTKENTMAASMSGATMARHLARGFDAACVYCDDAAFVMAPLLGAMQANDPSIRWIWVAHSTSHTHDDRPLNPDKVGMEAACVNAVREFPNICLGAISPFIADHLVRDYAAPREKIVPTGNGVDPLDEKYRIRTQAEIEAKLERINAKLPAGDRIPLDRPLLFSFGRPVPYKRLDLTLRAAAGQGGAAAGFHPVVVTLGDAPELRALRAEHKVEASLIDAFDFELVAALSQHEKTLAVAVLAKDEPFGLIPSEVRLLARATGGLLIAAKDGGGLAEQVTDGRDGFVVDRPEDPAVIRRAIARIQALEPAQAKKMRRAGRDKVFDEGFTWSQRIVETLAALDPDVAAVEREVREELSAIEKAHLAGPDDSSFDD